MSALAQDTTANLSHTVSEELSKFVLGLTHAQIPTAVRERAKHLILDSVGIALASTKYPFASVSFAALEQLGAGKSPVIGIGRRLALRDAVLMNGTLIHGLDFDDTHSRGVIHATASSFPCALALADRDDRSGEALLAAYVAAMEVATRLGSVAKGGFHQVGFHPTGLVGAFGCTLAAARLLGLDEGRATRAQGIALSMASGSLEFLEDGSWTKRMHPGWAGVVGITAATLAQHGFVGPRGAYDGRFGLYASHLGSHFEQADLGLATENLGAAGKSRRSQSSQFRPATSLTRPRTPPPFCTSNTAWRPKRSGACACACPRRWSRPSANRSQTNAIRRTAMTPSSAFPTSSRPRS